MSRNRGDLFARLLGILVFTLGIAIIVGVITLAYQLFMDPNLAAPVKPVKGNPSASDIGMAFGRLLSRIFLLALGSYSGSLIANKGVHLYFSGLQGSVASLHPKSPETPVVNPSSTEVS